VSKETEEKPLYIDLINKSAIPIAVAIITLIGGLFAAYIQSKMSASSLISQREQAESELRATMFKDLVGPIIGTDPEKITIERKRLLVELLALNFGENFELKPLLIEVDEELAKRIEEKKEREKIMLERESLRSIARRVIGRQIAMLSNEGPKGDKTSVVVLDFFESPEEYLKESGTSSFFSENDFKYPYPFTKEKLCEAIKDGDYKLALKASEKTIDWLNELLTVSYFYDEVLKKNPDRKFSEAIKSLVEETKNYRGKDFSSLEEKQKDNVIKLNRLVLMEIFPMETPGYIIGNKKEIQMKSPDKGCDLYIRIESCDWYNQTCKVKIRSQIRSQDRPFEASFTLTWFDFPLTDNTLFADGNRFAFVFDQFYVDKNSVSVKLVWFPKVYFTPREHPINYSEFRKKLSIEVGK